MICAYARENPIAAIRKLDPHAKPVPLGGNRDYGFFGIATPAVHYTMILGRRDATASGGKRSMPGDYAFIDAFQTNSR